MSREKKLTNKQLAFIREYPIDWNATQAAIRAGYSEHSAEITGHKLANNDIIKAKLNNKIEVLSNKSDNSIQRILEELCKIAFFDIRDIMSWTDTGVAFIDSAKINENTARAISEVVETVTTHGGQRRVKMHDKLKALELLGKYAGMFKDRVEIDAKITTQTLHDIVMKEIEDGNK